MKRNKEKNLGSKRNRVKDGDAAIEKSSQLSSSDYWVFEFVLAVALAMDLRSVKWMRAIFLGGFGFPVIPCSGFYRDRNVYKI